VGCEGLNPRAVDQLAFLIDLFFVVVFFIADDFIFFAPRVCSSSVACSLRKAMTWEDLEREFFFIF